MKFKTLHEAITNVRESLPAWMSFEDIAEITEKERLWKRPSDGSFPEAFQIRLRTVVNAKYKRLFIENKEDRSRLKR